LSAPVVWFTPVSVLTGTKTCFSPQAKTNCLAAESLLNLLKIMYLVIVQRLNVSDWFPKIKPGVFPDAGEKELAAPLSR